MRLDALIVSIAFSSWIAHAAENPPRAAGRIVSVVGKVLVRNGDDAADKVQVVKSGDPVGPGSVINTSSNSNAKVLLADRTIIDIGPSTLFKVDEFKPNSGSDRDVKMSMDYGKIRTSVTQAVTGRGSFSIRTKSATMGVRGTQFVVNSELGNVAPSPSGTPPSKNSAPVDSKTEITVLNGKVEVSQGTSGKAVPVTSGQQFTSQQTASGTFAPPKVTSLSKEQLASVAATKMSDPTFSQAVEVKSGGERGGGSGGGVASATIAAITESFVASQAQFQQAAPIGVRGTFGKTFGIDRPTFVPAGSAVTISVTYKAN